MTTIPERFGKYELLELHPGGMAEVYRARDTQIDRIVALKRPLAELSKDADYRRRFEREIITLAKLQHDAIVSILEYGEFDGRPYYTMPWMEGGTLAGVLKQGRISPQQADVLVQRICKGLHDAHEQSIVHLDLKPANLLFDAKRESIYLTDFGIARLLTSNTQTTTTHVTYEYASPESIRGKQPDRRADIYQMGIIIWEMLCGQLPFKPEDPDASANYYYTYAHVHEPTPPLSVDLGGATRHLNSVIQKATAKQPDQRYATALELATDFAAAAQGKRPPIAGQTNSVIIKGPKTPGPFLWPPNGFPGRLGLASMSVVGLILVAWLIMFGFDGRPEPTTPTPSLTLALTTAGTTEVVERTPTVTLAAVQGVTDQSVQVMAEDTTPTPRPTNTATSPLTPTRATSTSTPTPLRPTNTSTPHLTITPTPRPITPTPRPITPTPWPTNTPTPWPTNTPTPWPTNTPTPWPTNTPTPWPTNTPTPWPTNTPTPWPTNTPTPWPTNTPVPPTDTPVPPPPPTTAPPTTAPPTTAPPTTAPPTTAPPPP